MTTYDTSKLIPGANGMVKTGENSEVNANNLSPLGYQQALDYATSKGVLPSSNSTASTSATNTQTGTPSAPSLLDFKDTISQVVNLAKEKRNSMSLDFMRPFQGTVAASDFSDILSNLNKASDKTTEDLVKKATPTWKIDQVGSDLYQYQIDGNGKIIGQPQKVLSGGTDIAGDPQDADYWANTVLNGNATMAQVPANLKNAVNRVLNTPGEGAKYSPLAGQRFATESNRITNNFINLPQYQLTANGLPYIQRIDAAMQTPGSISDQDLLDSMTKLNTAGNSVTDAQVSIITNGKSFSDAINVFENKLKNGGVLSNSQRQQLQKIAKAVYDNYKTGYQPVYDQVTKQLRDAGVPEAFWTIPNLNKLSAEASSGVPSSEANSYRTKYGY